jgi:nucleoside-specific channel-forming protein
VQKVDDVAIALQLPLVDRNLESGLLNPINGGFTMKAHRLLHLVASVGLTAVVSAHAADNMSAGTLEQNTFLAASNATIAEAGPAQGQALSAPALSEKLEESPKWFHNTLGPIFVQGSRFGPVPVNDIYLEYEFYGRKGPFDLYGYIDIPKFLGVGNKNDSGIWDKGSPLFFEMEPRISIDDVIGKRLGFGPFK